MRLFDVSDCGDLSIRRAIFGEKSIKYGEGGFGWSPTLPYGSCGHSLRRHNAASWEQFFPHFSFDVFFWLD